MSARETPSPRPRPRLGAAPVSSAALVLCCLAAVSITIAVLGDGGTGDGGRTAAAPGPLSPAAADQAGRRALSLVDVSPAALGYELHFAPARDGGEVRAQLDRGRRRITVFVAAAEPAHLTAHDIAHELGHAADDRLLGDRERREWLRARGVPEARWWPGGGLSDYATGAGDFAEVFALCHAASPEYRSTLAPRPKDPCRLLPELPGGTRMEAR